MFRNYSSLINKKWKLLTSIDEEGSCKWFNWENIIWLQLFLPQLRCWWRGDDGDVDIDDTMWSERKGNPLTHSQWLTSLQGYWPIGTWAHDTAWDTCALMCSQPNKFIELLAVVIAKLEFYHTTWSMEQPLIRRLAQGLTVTHRIQKPFSNVLITALAKDNNRCQVQIMYKNAKPNALFQAPCDIWFK